jgi:hypothetical protein
MHLQERATDDPTGVQCQHVHLPATLLNRCGNALIASKVDRSAESGLTPPAGPQPFRRFVDAVVRDNETLLTTRSPDGQHH